MTSRRRVEDSERWCHVGSIEAGQSITDAALFFGVHHSVNSRLWKQFQTTQTVIQKPVAGFLRVTAPVEDGNIVILAKRNRRATSTRVISVVTASIGKAISASIVLVRLHMSGLYARVLRVCVFSMRPIKRGTLKVVPGTCQLDCVSLGQCLVY